MYRNALLVLITSLLIACGGGNDGSAKGSTSSGGATADQLRQLYYDPDNGLLVIVDSESTSQFFLASLALLKDERAEYIVGMNGIYDNNQLDLYQYYFHVREENRITQSTVVDSNQISATVTESTIDLKDVNAERVSSLDALDETLSLQDVTTVLAPLPVDNCENGVCKTTDMSIDPDTLVFHYLETESPESDRTNTVTVCEISGQLLKVTEQYFKSSDNGYVNQCGSGDEYTNVEIQMAFVPAGTDRVAIVLTYVDLSDPNNRLHYARWFY
ncbi:hypothetical protein ST37_01835 (plasmid) [Vibrio sp. qd031]|uniref:hypothetical protein n=1 Tax=Vibrio sp. qd031 TaxID=1603038 RepID=UPI000A1077B4|nr:hypothetical protein [Vibrio sp. qd031]ORT52533.1 hypothetical protein ST37_01835 [Vibrio sp. qd031]